MAEHIADGRGNGYVAGVDSINRILTADTPLSDYAMEIARGNIPGQTSVFKFGRSTAITSTETIVWDGQSNYTFLEVAETLDIVSTSVEDAAGGTGAITMLVQGLDSSYNEISELVTLTGQTPLTTTNSFLRTFRMIVITSGTNDPVTNSNKGVVSATGTDTGALQARILINNGQTLMLVYTIPAGKTGYVTGANFSTGEGKQVLFKGKFRNGSDPTNAFSVKYTLDLYQSPFFAKLDVPLQVPEKTDIVVTAQSSTGVSVDGTATIGFILIDN